MGLIGRQVNRASTVVAVLKIDSECLARELRILGSQNSCDQLCVVPFSARISPRLTKSLGCPAAQPRTSVEMTMEQRLGVRKPMRRFKTFDHTLLVVLSANGPQSLFIPRWFPVCINVTNVECGLESKVLRLRPV